MPPEHFLRLCTEEVTAALPLPAWASPADRAAGRIVCTPPSSPPSVKCDHQVVPPWATDENKGGQTSTAGAGGRGPGRLEETAQKAKEVLSAAEAAPQRLKDLLMNPHLIIPASLKCPKQRTPRKCPKEDPLWHRPGKDDARAVRTHAKQSELALARQQTNEAVQEAVKAKRRLEEKHQQIAPCAAGSQEEELGGGEWRDDETADAVQRGLTQTPIEHVGAGLAEARIQSLNGT
eukprot:g20200.t1